MIPALVSVALNSLKIQERRPMQMSLPFQDNRHMQKPFPRRHRRTISKKCSTGKRILFSSLLFFVVLH